MNTLQRDYDPLNEQIRDYTSGGLDGLTVAPAIAAGLVAAGASKRVILIAIIAEAIAGSISMGLGDYLGVDAIETRKDIAWKSGLRVGISYLLGASIVFFAYYVSDTATTGLQLSLVLNLFALIAFGVYRARMLNIDPLISTKKVVIVGAFAMFATYFVSRALHIT